MKKQGDLMSDVISELPVILLVDDSAKDCLLMQQAFIRAKVLNPLVAVQGGEEALMYLSGTGKYANRAEYPLPAFILLDIRMPRMDGFEVLRWIRTQPRLETLRVVMLTASDDTRDMNLAYQLGANSFLVKPVDFERFAEISQALSGCWLLLDRAPEAVRIPGANLQNGTEKFPRQPGEKFLSQMSRPEVHHSNAPPQ
ncbi:MAG: response regulator [Methylacidiphilales bacterium]|nr:response regulator [Candidatus Methylacidiphilales bacterium]